MNKEKMNIDDEIPVEVDFSGGERGRYRGRIKPGDTDLRNAKVRVNIYLDGDIIEYFKNMAGKPGADKYQTQINRVLREYIDGGRQDALVSDTAFIDAVAQRVQERLAR
jgi:uncharacterized protein (DUF4415 family)